jgi:hypothetical protein
MAFRGFPRRNVSGRRARGRQARRPCVSPRDVAHPFPFDRPTRSRVLDRRSGSTANDASALRIAAGTDLHKQVEGYALLRCQSDVSVVSRMVGRGHHPTAADRLVAHGERLARHWTGVAAALNPHVRRVGNRLSAVVGPDFNRVDRLDRVPVALDLEVAGVVERCAQPWSTRRTQSFSNFPSGSYAARSAEKSESRG